MRWLGTPSALFALLQANVTMALRSRGVMFAVFASALQILVIGLLPNLGFNVGGQKVNFFDFALPGMATFLVVYQLQDITVAVASGYRARGILKRLAVTPVSPAQVIITQAVTYVFIGLAAAALIFTLGKLIGGKILITPNLLWLLPLIAVVVLTSLAIAFVIAGLTPNPQTAGNVGNTVTFFMFALTGALLPIEALPDPLPSIVPYAVPHAALIHVIREIALRGADVTAYGQQILIGSGWLIATFTAAAKTYRFTED